MTFQNKLLEIVKLEATNLWPDVNLPEFEITTPPNPEFGDLSIALPLPVAKLLEANPIDIAEKLKEALAKREIEHINKVTVTNPGFVNFVIDFPSLSKTTLKKVLSQKENYGKNRLDMGQVIIEHTSVNPNKAVHVGHLRNACLGDSLVRIMRSSGFEVETQNYIDDTGAQVADIIVAQEHLPDEQKKDEPFDYYCWDIYTKIQKFYEADEKLVERKKEVLKLIEEGNNETSQKASEIANKVIDRHLKT
ncbi:MAG: arginine--tRNA ligase, partial [Patescibacteria group bacterium]|nr:arginine--tRNA ligase [Patescibacteria group bacterium]